MDVRSIPLNKLQLLGEREVKFTQSHNERKIT